LPEPRDDHPAHPCVPGDERGLCIQRRHGFGAARSVAAFIALFAFATAPGRSPADTTRVEPAPRPTTVYVVRHAEQVRDTTDKNPPLSEAGTMRARALRDELKGARLSAVFATHYRRSQGTALPVAESHQLEVSAYEPKDFAGLAKRIREGFQGKSVLVVGHSNTVPGIIAGLGGPKLDDLGHDEFDALFLVSVYPDTAKAAKLRYGAAPAAAPKR
jgi:phosphohistidine phosphatase SixA